jgi:hypothetical protein
MGKWRVSISFAPHALKRAFRRPKMQSRTRCPVCRIAASPSPGPTGDPQETCFDSQRRRPTSVDLPSSSLLRVMNRNGSASEIALPLLLSHGNRLIMIDRSLLAFGSSGCLRLADNLLDNTGYPRAGRFGTAVLNRRTALLAPNKTRPINAVDHLPEYFRTDRWA